MWFVYVLQSIKDGKKYIGSTNDLNRRISSHNKGEVRSTKNRKPFKLIYCEKHAEEKVVRFREKFFKTHKGFIKLNEIINKRSVV